MTWAKSSQLFAVCMRGGGESWSRGSVHDNKAATTHLPDLPLGAALLTEDGFDFPTGLQQTEFVSLLLELLSSDLT